MNVVESEETSEETTAIWYWYVWEGYVESWNLAAAIWYVKMDECCWKWRNNYLICWEG